MMPVRIILLLVLALNIATAENYYLIDVDSGNQQGPYTWADGEPLGNSALYLSVHTNATVTVSGYVRGIKRTYGPFSIKDGSLFTIGQSNLRLVRGSSAQALEESAKRSREEAVAQRAAFEDKQKARGMVNINGRWYAKGEVDTYYLTQVIKSAREDRTYESAIRTLEGGLSQYPDAQNRSDALQLLATYKQEYNSKLSEARSRQQSSVEATANDNAASAEVSQPDSASVEEAEPNTEATEDDDDWGPRSSILAWLLWWLLPAVAIFVYIAANKDETATTRHYGSDRTFLGTSETPTGRIIEGDVSGGAALAILWLVGYPCYWLFWGWWQ